MAPGAKKKQYSRKSGDTTSESNKKKIHENALDKQQAACLNNSKPDNEENDVQSKKYNRRTINSNWEKYEENVPDPHADTLRGKDLEVLLSYSSGSGSQLQLKHEKEWEEDTCNEDTNICVDLKDLVHVVKSVPFYKLINLDPTIFSREQLKRYDSSAENWRNSYAPISKSEPMKAKNIESCEEKVEILDSTLNLVESCEVEDVKEDLASKPVLLEEKTENIIESLTSCLSLKTPVVEKTDLVLETDNESKNVPDDLDFLLSLNVSLKNPLQDKAKGESSKTNVDDWLNSILDD